MGKKSDKHEAYRPERIQIEMKKKLIQIEIVLVCLLLFFSLALILSRSILPNHGIYIYSEINGESMNPTIVEGALIVGRHTPYEELQVGDIIAFRMRKEYRFSSSSTTSNLTKGSVTKTTEHCVQAGQAAHPAPHHRMKKRLSPQTEGTSHKGCS